jgi:hypothetical protein
MASAAEKAKEKRLELERKQKERENKTFEKAQEITLREPVIKKAQNNKKSKWNARNSSTGTSTNNTAAATYNEQDLCHPPFNFEQFDRSKFKLEDKKPNKPDDAQAMYYYSFQYDGKRGPIFDITGHVANTPTIDERYNSFSIAIEIRDPVQQKAMDEWNKAAKNMVLDAAKAKPAEWFMLGKNPSTFTWKNFARRQNAKDPKFRTSDRDEDYEGDTFIERYPLQFQANFVMEKNAKVLKTSSFDEKGNIIHPYTSFKKGNLVKLRMKMTYGYFSNTQKKEFGIPCKLIKITRLNQDTDDFVRQDDFDTYGAPDDNDDESNNNNNNNDDTADDHTNDKSAENPPAKRMKLSSTTVSASTGSLTVKSEETDSVASAPLAISTSDSVAKENKEKEKSGINSEMRQQLQSQARLGKATSTSSSTATTTTTTTTTNTNTNTNNTEVNNEKAKSKDAVDISNKSESSTDKEKDKDPSKTDPKHDKEKDKEKEKEKESKKKEDSKNGKSNNNTLNDDKKKSTPTKKS